jgi:hypothetical protein
MNLVDNIWPRKHFIKHVMSRHAFVARGATEEAHDDDCQPWASMTCRTHTHSTSSSDNQLLKRELSSKSGPRKRFLPPLLQPKSAKWKKCMKREEDGLYHDDGLAGLDDGVWRRP